MSDKIEITKEEYVRLKIGEIKLDRLENGGVNNWEWYDESLNPEGEESLYKIKEQLKKEFGLE